MRVSLEKVRFEPFAWQETIAVAAEKLQRSVLIELSPIEWWGHIDYEQPNFALRGSLSYEQTLSCGRCLRPETEAVEAEVELSVIVGEEPDEPGEHELQTSDLLVWYVDEPWVDTHAVLIEQLQLNVPMTALCREDCAGLCPTCGANRNDRECDCQTDDVDPRWSELAALRERME